MIKFKTDEEIAAMNIEELRRYAFELFCLLTPDQQEVMLAKMEKEVGRK